MTQYNGLYASQAEKHIRSVRDRVAIINDQQLLELLKDQLYTAYLETRQRMEIVAQEEEGFED